jgi:HPt (histidine-containing phosphotransfer) domain-containing protein
MKLHRESIPQVPVAAMSTLSANPGALVPGTPSSDLPDNARGSAIDRNHLARMTLGDGNLESEILSLFRRQAAMLLGRMANERPRVVAALAHTLTGSARGVGAWQVAAAAEAVERAAIGNDPAAVASELRGLSAAIARAQIAIADLTQAG